MYRYVGLEINSIRGDFWSEQDNLLERNLIRRKVDSILEGWEVNEAVNGWTNSEQKRMGGKRSRMYRYQVRGNERVNTFTKVKERANSENWTIELYIVRSENGVF